MVLTVAIHTCRRIEENCHGSPQIYGRRNHTHIPKACPRIYCIAICAQYPARTLHCIIYIPAPFLTVSILASFVFLVFFFLSFIIAYALLPGNKQRIPLLAWFHLQIDSPTWSNTNLWLALVTPAERTTRKCVNNTWNFLSGISNALDNPFRRSKGTKGEKAPTTINKSFFLWHYKGDHLSL